MHTVTDLIRELRRKRGYCLAYACKLTFTNVKTTVMPQGADRNLQLLDGKGFPVCYFLVGSATQDRRQELDESTSNS